MDRCSWCRYLCDEEASASTFATRDQLKTFFDSLAARSPRGKAANLPQLRLVLGCQLHTSLADLLGGEETEDRLFLHMAEGVDKTPTTPSAQTFQLYSAVGVPDEIGGFVGAVLCVQREDRAEPYVTHKHPFNDLLAPVKSIVSDDLAADMASVGPRWDIHILACRTVWNAYGGSDTLVVDAEQDTIAVRPAAEGGVPPMRPPHAPDPDHKDRVPDLLEIASGVDSAPPPLEKRARPVRRYEGLAEELMMVLASHGLDSESEAEEILQAEEDA